MFAGVTGQGDIRRALVRFDVAGVVPPGSVINNAWLTLSMSRTRSGSQDIGLHRVLAPWGEGTSVATRGEGGCALATAGDATWLHTFFGTDFWAAAGGDFDVVPSATLSVSGVGSYTWWTTRELVADVQGWLDAPGTNHGWLLVGSETAGSTAKRFDTHEHPTASQRPILTVDYTAPPPCTLSLSVAHFGGTLFGEFMLGTEVSATWNVWVIYRDDVMLLHSSIAGVTDPPAVIPVEVPGVLSLGTVGFLTTLTTDAGVICSDWETVDTGLPGVGITPDLGRLRVLFR
jgi:hypothetical protein